MASSYDYQDDLWSVSSSGSSSGRRFFRATSLGRPPGLPKPATFSTLPSSIRSTISSTSSSYDHQQTSPNKTAPFKELQKMIADLKKENFDLKLRLFHMNWLEQENERLTSALDDVSHSSSKRPARSVGTQTLFVDVSPATTAYYTAFETSPEAFGLTPHRATPLLSSDVVDSVERVADAFSTVRIVSSSSPDPIRGWLEKTQRTPGMTAAEAPPPMTTTANDHPIVDEQDKEKEERRRIRKSMNHDHANVSPLLQDSSVDRSIASL